LTPQPHGLNPENRYDLLNRPRGGRCNGFTIDRTLKVGAIAALRRIPAIRRSARPINRSCCVLKRTAENQDAGCIHPEQDAAVGVQNGRLKNKSICGI